MSKFSATIKRFGGFLKRNAFYLLVILCIASIATVIALAVTYNNVNETELDMSDAPVVNPDDNDPGNTPTTPDDEQNEPEIPEKKLTFNMPCNGNVQANYSDAKLVWNASMKDYRTHMGIDFVSDDLNVFASAEGTIKETGYNRLDGYYILIEHADGYKTKYMSLESAGNFKEGDKIEQGQLIGKMAISQGTEDQNGPHLHFEVYKDDNSIDPLEVLIMEEK